MGTTTNKTVFLKDYTSPDYLIPRAELEIQLDDALATVKATLTVIKNHSTKQKPIVLHGEHMDLISIKKDGKKLSPSEYKLTENHLSIPCVTKQCSLEITTEIHPNKNLALEGIYKSDSIICSQNEPEGFRRITYFVDRPDNMCHFTTTLIGDKEKYPYLLSNGNPIKRKTLPNGKHSVTWDDPFPKPSYLFAVVAGDLGKISDTFVTKSNRKIKLEIYVDKGNESRATYAMTALKNSMKWDEDVFGREYDLDIFMIVAVDAFNMGAMENKGLNIFNSQYVLADQKTATDADYKNIEAVVAHEYFHNWTGNRITCRDWFQLTLKEGLTVYRDQEFSSDMNVRAIERIENVRQLKSVQFPEDASPMAHPIKPASYIEINNFYTSTVYEKGAEIIRMIHTILGPKLFKKGMDLYFKSFDGQAVTTEDFLWAMEKASSIDLTQFKRWYFQAGTPEVTVTSTYNKAKKEYRLAFRQSCKPTPETKTKKPFAFPIVTGLLSQNGKELQSEVVLVTKKNHAFTFKNVAEKPIPSLLRNFSAPIKLHYAYTEEELIILMTKDSDPFNRYEASQRLAMMLIHSLIDKVKKKKALQVPSSFLQAFGQCLDDSQLDPAIKAEMLTLPSTAIIIDSLDTADFKSVIKAREFIVTTLTKTHAAGMHKVYSALSPSPTALDSRAMSERKLKNTLLHFLANMDCEYTDLAYYHFKNAQTMTDQISALSALNQQKTSETEAAMKAFYKQWKDDALIMNKWFAVQMSSKRDDVMQTLLALEKNPKFDNKNPNKLRALYGTFAGNPYHFHHESGEGYALLRSRIETIDTFNPSIAARLANAFKLYPKLPASLKKLAKQELTLLKNNQTLSKNTREIVEKTLTEPS